MYVSAEFARELERENTALATMVDSLRTTLWGMEFELEKTRKEIDALQADIDWIADPDSPLPRICLFPSYGWANQVSESRLPYCKRLREAINETRQANIAFNAARAKEGGAS
jgi:hypothetical protein